MRKTISLLLCVVTIFYCFGFLLSANGNDAFSDVPKGSWYYNAVYYCVNKGIFSGTSKNTFSPQNELTRAMAVTVLSGMDGYDSTKYTDKSAFSDVKSDMWYFAPINWASANGIASGYTDNTFRPDEPITREQFALMVYKYKKYKGVDVSADCGDIDTHFADSAKISSWSKNALSWAVAIGMISGTDEHKVNPQKALTRAEASVMCYRASGKLLCVYYDGVSEAGFNMDEDDIRSTDIIYYLGLYVKSDATVELSNVVIKPQIIANIKEINPDIKVLITLIGNNKNARTPAQEFSLAVMNESKRATLVNNITDIVVKYGFDGVDINWEYPSGKYDFENEVLLAHELRASMKKHNPDAMLTAAVPATMYGFETHDLLGLLPEVDYFNVMTYDFHINDNETLHHTPTYNDATGKYAERGYSCQKTVEIFTREGIPSYKIIIGCGLYTLEWRGVNPNDNNGFNMKGIRVYNHTYRYNELPSLQRSGFIRYWDSTACAAYWFNPKTGVFLSSDDDESVRAKSKLSYDTYTAGLMMFSYYTFRGGTLLESARQWTNGYYAYPASVIQ